MAKEANDGSAVGLKVCAIAEQLKAHTILLYYCQNVDTNYNYIPIGRCLSEMPSYSLKTAMLVKELPRNSSSLSIFVLLTLADTKNVINFLNDRQKDKQTHKYVFIVENWPLNEVDAFLQQLWQKSILNAVLISENSKSFQVYSYDPFSPNGFRTFLMTDNDSEYFVDRLKNLNRFQLRISMFIEPIRSIPLPPNATLQGYRGIDGLVTSNTLQQLNATGLYISPADEERYGVCSDGKYTGILGDLLRRNTHVNFNARFMLECEYEPFEFIQLYHKKVLVLVVPAPEMLPMYGIIFRTLKSQVWLLQLLSFIVIAIMFWLLEIILRRAHIQLSKSSITESVVRIYLRQPLDNINHIQLSLQCLITTWSLYTYILTSIYFAKLSSNFVQPSYEPAINALSEVHRIKVPIYSEVSTITVVQNAISAEVRRELDSKFIETPSSMSGVDFVLETFRKQNIKLGLLTRDEVARELLHQTFDRLTKRPAFHIVNEYLHGVPSRYIMPAGTPFLHKFKRLLSFFYEHGFYEHWQKIEDVKRRLHSKQENAGTEEEGGDSADKVVLSLEILQSSFYLWILGVLLAGLAFALEILYYKQFTIGKIYIL